MFERNRYHCFCPNESLDSLDDDVAETISQCECVTNEYRVQINWKLHSSSRVEYHKTKSPPERGGAYIISLSRGIVSYGIWYHRDLEICRSLESS